MEYIRKRDGRLMAFDSEKIASAICKAFKATDSQQTRQVARKIAEEVVARLNEAGSSLPTVELVQDMVEEVLIEKGYIRAAKAYILYRAERSRSREMNSRLMKTFESITLSKRQVTHSGNANINGDGPMGTMLRFGAEAAKTFNEMYVLKPSHARSHQKGEIDIHHMDFLTQTTACCQIDLSDLLAGGFSTGRGILREPNHITAYSVLCCIALQSNQNDQDDGQSIVNFDMTMAMGVKKSYRHHYYDHVRQALVLLCPDCDADTLVNQMQRDPAIQPDLAHSEMSQAHSFLRENGISAALTKRILDYACSEAVVRTNHETYQAMEALIHNLNTIYSRAGARVPESTINYGLDTSLEGRMVMENLLKATMAGIGQGTSAPFPVQILRLKKGINLEPGDPNYDLYQLALQVIQKRRMPYLAFADAPYNQEDVAYFGNGIRVYENVHDPLHQGPAKRGMLAYTSINLVRIALRAKGDMEWFFEELDRKLELVQKELMERYTILSQIKAYYYPFLMGQHVWLGSEKLESADPVGAVLKEGILGIGFIGLDQCLETMQMKDEESAYNLGISIVSHMRRFVDSLNASQELNYALISSMDKEACERLCELDRKAFKHHFDHYDPGFCLSHVTDPIKRVQAEALFHEFCSGGHISCLELDAKMDLEAVVKALRETPIGLLSFK